MPRTRERLASNLNRLVLDIQEAITNLRQQALAIHLREEKGSCGVAALR